MRVYAYQDIPEVVEKSSSGGAFTAIANSFCDNHKDFSIYGAVWTKDLKVNHLRVVRREEIECFRGSKYVRSNIKGTYIDVKNDLQNGKFVLFSGTPCQVGGLKKYLETQKVSMDKLLTVDIICHGAPNPVILDDFKSWIERKYKQHISSITFRDKSVGWKRYPTSIHFENGKILRWSYDAQLYIRIYFSLLILETKCYSCEYSNRERVSDITIGDFWGIETVMPEISPNKGVSLVIVNSIKGENILKHIQKNISKREVLKECYTEAYLDYQHNLNKPTEMPYKYRQFWDDYKKYGFDHVIREYGFYTRKGKLKFFIKSVLLHFKWFEKRLF